MQLCSALHLERHVSFKGVLPKREMAAAFGRYDALLLPTWERDPCPTVIGEAASAGCLPIFTQVAGIAEWLFDGEDCIKIPREARALMSAMRKVMACDGKTKQEVSTKLMEKMGPLFDFENWYPKIEELAWKSSSRTSLVPSN